MAVSAPMPDDAGERRGYAGEVVGTASDETCQFNFSIPLDGTASFYTLTFGDFGQTTYSGRPREQGLVQLG